MPLFLAGLATTAVGTGLTIAGNDQSQNAINSTRQAFNTKQQGLMKQGNQVVQDAMPKLSADQANQTMQEGASQRAQLAAALQQSSNPVTNPIPNNSGNKGYEISDPVSAATNRAQSAGNASRTMATGAAAREGAYNDLGTQQGITLQDARTQLAPIISNAQGNANLLPVELNVASQKGNSLTGWGSLASTLGGLGMMGGAMGLGARAAAAPSMATVGPGSLAATPNLWGNLVDPAAGGSFAQNPNLWGNIFMPR